MKAKSVKTDDIKKASYVWYWPVGMAVISALLAKGNKVRMVNTAALLVCLMVS